MLLWPGTLRSWTKPSQHNHWQRWVQINAKFELSHFWCPRKSQHTTHNWPARPKLMITYLITARSSKSCPSCMSFQPLLLSSIPLCHKHEPVFYFTINFSICRSAEHTFLQMAPGTSQGLGRGSIIFQTMLAIQVQLQEEKRWWTNSISKVNSWSANNLWPLLLICKQRFNFEGNGKWYEQAKLNKNYNYIMLQSWALF